MREPIQSSAMLTLDVVLQVPVRVEHDDCVSGRQRDAQTAWCVANRVRGDATKQYAPARVDSKKMNPSEPSLLNLNGDELSQKKRRQASTDRSMERCLSEPCT